MYSGDHIAPGCAFPDAAAIGDNPDIVYESQSGLIVGMLYPSPILVNVVALLYDKPTAARKNSL